MRLKKLALVSLIGLPLLAATTAANADARFWRHAATLGATSGSFYTTSRDDHKIVAATQDDASSYLASNGQIRGPYLEAALRDMRAAEPGLKASDNDLAMRILTQ
ncbi:MULTISPECIES: DUF2388 domain-containing protein [Pseudomonas]|uniref:Ribonucleotide reductase n=2 Tax=Pseudomonas TaxID=286 RepID=A0A178LDM4_9PSED|nr:MULTISPECIES: DUF2388 domain-containing protein [Pseudomonas]MCD4864463.1 DUF2388 domain-containing protein [Pseudomonas sp. PLB05]MCI1009085.1 DUF2388 domain-containing protein [Pseudomonas oryzihabitans]MXS17711.1 DUF2388 domain-containing protein [Pseudomonas oryzihabitans]NRH42538.1 DUF2388 domain-containing protein [Pseudomonas sp. MS15a(2019)]OAN28511.1 ribonucleotide reductase [Pseudomonas oryzihabitans]